MNRTLRSLAENKAACQVLSISCRHRLSSNWLEGRDDRLELLDTFSTKGRVATATAGGTADGNHIGAEG
jgi:hypothetical protein